MEELIVYPTIYGVRQHRAKQLEGKVGVTGSFPVTYEVFIQKCIEKDILHYSFLGDFKKNIILRRICDQVFDKLIYFDHLRDGYIHKIGEVIGELKRQDISPETFKTICKESPVNQDIFLIYNKYRQFLQENYLFDQEDRYLICKKSTNKEEYVSNYSKIHFKDFFELSPIQRKIIDSLGNIVDISNSSTEQEVRDIDIIKAQDRRTEVYFLAHQILKDLKDGLLPENMCIVIRQRHLYESLLFEVFEKAGIALKMEKSANLLQNPFIKALLSYLRGQKSSYFDDEFYINTYNSKKSIGIWSNELLKLLNDLDFPCKLFEFSLCSMEMLKRDLEAYNALRELLTELYEIEQIFPGKILGFEDFIEYIEMHLKNRIYNTNTPRDGIWVLAPTMLRGLCFDKIYCLGLVDGEYPRGFRQDWLLKDDERSKINASGYEIDTVDSLLKREKESFRFLLASGGKGYFSYPLLLENNTPSLVSAYLEDIMEEKGTSNIKKIDFESVFCWDNLKEPKTDTFKNVNEESVKEEIKAKFSKYRFSTTALNAYGECPFKFFLSRILNLTSEEPEEFTALDRGNITHEVLELFFKNHREGLVVEELEKYIEEIRMLLEKLLQRGDYIHNFPHPKLLTIEKEEILENIKTYIEYQIKNQGDFAPYRLELGFGYNKVFYLDTAKDIYLCGKIDRIDMDPSGKIVVFDYKNSWTPDINHIKEGTNFQMPLYIMATEKLLGKPVSGGAFISIKKGKVDSILVRDRDLPFVSKRRRKGVLSNEEWDNLMNKVMDNIRFYVENIRDAKFPVEPKKCPKIDRYGSFCDFTRVCPFEGVE